MLWFKLSSGQSTVEVTVVVSMHDAGIFVLLLQKLYSSLMMTEFHGLRFLSFGTISLMYGVMAYIIGRGDNSC